MEMSGRGEVVSNIVGILFDEPDRIIRGHLGRHQAKATSWRRHLLEGPGMGIKDGQEVAAHFSKPEASFMIDGRSHQLTIELW